MLLIGIDEAGYGPKIGPLCHGYAALRCPDCESGTPPDLWELLHPSVMRHPAYVGSLIVDDSKKIYTPALGLRVLQQGIRSFLDCLGAANSASSDDMYQRILPDADRARLEEDCWGRALENMAQEADKIAAEQAASEAEALKKKTPRRKKEKPHPLGPPPKNIPCLSDALNSRNVSVLALGARALSARHYNAALTNHASNKADVNWNVIAEEFSRLMSLAQPGEDIYAVIDRQGGRKFYTGKISALFAGSMAWVEKETPHASIYKIETPERTIRVAFLVDADGLSFPVALGSMAAKLARELCMQRLNAFFKSHAPEIRPTAGYYGDANRFLKETKALRKKLAIENAALIRTK